MGDAEEFHADKLYDVSSSGINKNKSVGDVFAGRVEHGIVKPGECPGDNVDFNIKRLDKNNTARSGDVMLYKKDTSLGQTRRERTVEQKVNVPVPEILGETLEVVKPRDQEIPLERIWEQSVEVTTPQITEDVFEVKEMITDQMNRLQVTDDAVLDMGVNANEIEEMIGTAVRETLDELDKNHAAEDDEFETAMQDTLDRLNKTSVTENGESEKDALDRLHKDHAAENDEIDHPHVMERSEKLSIRSHRSAYSSCITSNNNQQNRQCKKLRAGRTGVRGKRRRKETRKPGRRKE